MFKNKKMPTSPSLLPNGSGFENLKARYKESYLAVKSAEETLAASAPHGRDFEDTMAGSDAFADAVGEHEARVTKLRMIQAELLEIISDLNRKSFKK